MAKAQRVTYFKINLEDKPGALFVVAKDLKAKNIGLVALKALASQPGQSGVFLIAKNPQKLRDALKSLNMTFEEGTSFFLKGVDKTGALLKSLGAIADAGINIMDTDAIAVGGNYGSFFRVAPPDVEKTAQALGAK
jgi:hypothetical protein